MRKPAIYRAVDGTLRHNRRSSMPLYEGPWGWFFWLVDRSNRFSKRTVHNANKHTK